MKPANFRIVVKTGDLFIPVDRKDKREPPVVNRKNAFALILVACRLFRPDAGYRTCRSPPNHFKSYFKFYHSNIQEGYQRFSQSRADISVKLNKEGTDLLCKLCGVLTMSRVALALS